MTPLGIFEELRFIWELVAAEFLLLLPFAKKKERFPLRTAVGVLILSIICLGYFGLLERVTFLPHWPMQFVICFWYIALALLTMGYIRCCFQLTVHDAIYMCIAGYAAQHMIYVPVHEVLALDVWPELTENLPLYGAVAALVCLLVYIPVHCLFAPKLRLCNGQMFDDSPVNIVLNVILLSVLMVCAFAGQYLFQDGGDMRYIGVTLDLLCSMMILGIQYLSLRMAQASREQAIIQQTLMDSERRFEISRELIEVANRSCHDLKHSVQAMKLAGEGERQEFIAQTEETIRLYQKYIHSGNVVLDALLAEKSLACERQQIALSCSVNDADLSFLPVADLYVLLGNAIDNAVECVAQFEQPEKRVISLTIQRQYAFLSIQTNNYCPAVPAFRNGLPMTTKKSGLHGYGLKSIRYIAAKHGGTVQTTVKDQVFILQILIPLAL